MENEMENNNIDIITMDDDEANIQINIMKSIKPTDDDNITQYDENEEDENEEEEEDTSSIIEVKQTNNENNENNESNEKSTNLINIINDSVTSIINNSTENIIFSEKNIDIIDEQSDEESIIESEKMPIITNNYQNINFDKKQYSYKNTSNTPLLDSMYNNTPQYIKSKRNNDVNKKESIIAELDKQFSKSDNISYDLITRMEKIQYIKSRASSDFNISFDTLNHILSDIDIHKYYVLCLDKERENRKSATIDMLFSILLTFCSSIKIFNKYTKFIEYLNTRRNETNYKIGIKKISSLLNNDIIENKFDYIMLGIWLLTCYSDWSKLENKENQK